MNRIEYPTRIASCFIGSLLSLILLLPLEVQGQLKQRYEGPLQLGDFLGEAEYTYLVTEGDTLLEGPFAMQRSSLTALLENKDVSFSFLGAFSKGYPNGPWKFQFGEFKSDNTTQVVDFQYTLAISGFQTTAAGELTMGKPQGLWRISRDQIQGSQVERNLFKSQILFESGIPQQSFQVADSINTLVGRFLRDGVAHDNWELYTDGTAEAVEVWNFEEGVLKGIQTRSDTEIIVNAIFDFPFSIDTIINLDKRYLQIVELWRGFKNPGVSSQGQVAVLLSQNADFYARIDGILSALGKSSFRPEFKVRVPYFPLDTLERSQLDSITQLFATSNTLSQGVLNDTHLNILKLSEKETEYLYNVVAGISEQFLVPVGKIVGYQSDGVLEHVSREKLISQLWPDGKPSESISITLGEDQNEFRTFQGVAGAARKWQANDLDAVLQLTKYAARSLDSVAVVLRDKSAEEQRQQEEIQLEEKLLAQVNHLNTTVDSLVQDLPPPHLRALQHIKKTVADYLTTYSSEEQPDKKVRYGKQLNRCFAQMDTLVLAVKQLPEQSKAIADIYQDAVWNPFTATIMNERVKKRITNSYNRVLIPYLLEQIATELDCDNAKTYTTILEKLHVRMLELREEETRKLERKLKKTQDPAEILQLLNLLNTENQK
ncbi:MAG: hypothetical protein AAF717_01990 [Bacteroidota bacterium]